MQQLTTSSNILSRRDCLITKFTPKDDIPVNDMSTYHPIYIHTQQQALTGHSQLTSEGRRDAAIKHTPTRDF